MTCPAAVQRSGLSADPGHSEEGRAGCRQGGTASRGRGSRAPEGKAQAGALLQQAQAEAEAAAPASAAHGAPAEAARAGTAHAAAAGGSQARQARAAQTLRAAAAQAATPLASRQQAGHLGSSQLPESVLSLPKSTGGRFQPAQPAAGKLCLNTEQLCLAKVHAKTVTNWQGCGWAQLCVSPVGRLHFRCHQCPAVSLRLVHGEQCHSVQGLWQDWQRCCPCPWRRHLASKNHWSMKIGWRACSYQASSTTCPPRQQEPRPAANVYLRAAAASVLASASDSRGPLSCVGLRHPPEVWCSAHASLPQSQCTTKGSCKSAASISQSCLTFLCSWLCTGCDASGSRETAPCAQQSWARCQTMR